VALASSAGAIGVILITDDPENPDEARDGNLRAPTRPEGSYVPTVGAPFTSLMFFC
jgi:carboxypeptidase Q